MVYCVCVGHTWHSRIQACGLSELSRRSAGSSVPAVLCMLRDQTLRMSLSVWFAAGCRHCGRQTDCVCLPIYPCTRGCTAQPKILTLELARSCHMRDLCYFSTYLALSLINVDHASCVQGKEMARLLRGLIHSGYTTSSTTAVAVWIVPDCGSHGVNSLQHPHNRIIQHGCAPRVSVQHALA